MTLTFVLLILKVVSESRVMWATSVPILVFLWLSFLDLGPMYATDRQTYVGRQTDVRQKHRLMPRLLGVGHNNVFFSSVALYSCTCRMFEILQNESSTRERVGIDMNHETSAKLWYTLTVQFASSRKRTGERLSVG